MVKLSKEDAYSSPIVDSEWPDNTTIRNPWMIRSPSTRIFLQPIFNSGSRVSGSCPGSLLAIFCKNRHGLVTLQAIHTAIGQDGDLHVENVTVDLQMRNAAKIGHAPPRRQSFPMKITRYLNPGI